MKITIYELLGMVKDGKAPKKFKYSCYVWTYNYESSAYWNGKGIEFEYFMDDGLMKYLNDEVEIIEEDSKIEKLKIINGAVDGKWENGSSYNYTLSAPQTVIIYKINEIIDKINEMENK